MATTRGGGLPLAVLFFLFLVSGALAKDRTGTASWVGAPDGAGNDNGGCGFGDTVTVPPLSAMVTGFGNDDECGMCYEVRCTGHPACMPSAFQDVRVTVTDSCRSALCAEPNNEHFDMVDCQYTPPSNYGRNVEFPCVKVDPSATKYNFSVTLLYTEGWASWRRMAVRAVTASGMGVMRHSHGATWYHDNPYNASFTVSAPMSMIVYSKSINDPPMGRMKAASLRNIIPTGWQPGAVYCAYL